MAVNQKEAMELLKVCLEAQKNGAILYPYLEGPPGIGKTQMPKDYASELDYGYKEVILGRYGCLDIQGLHVPDYESGKLKHFPTGRLLDPVPGKEFTIICLDEVSNAQSDVIAAIQSLLTSREIEGYKLPDNVLIVLSGNGVNDGCNSKPLSAAVMDRIVKIRVEVDKKAWLEWAENHGIDDYIIAYHGWNDEDLFNYNPDSDYEEDTFATPRSWERFDAVLKEIGDKQTKIMLELGKGIIGEGVVARFKSFKDVAHQMPTYDEVIKSPETCKFPKTLDTIYAVIANLVSAMKKLERRAIEIPESECVAITTYLGRFSEEWQVYGLRMLEKHSPQFKNSIACSEMEIRQHKLWHATN